MSASESVTSRLCADNLPAAGSAARPYPPLMVDRRTIAAEAVADLLTSAAAVLAAFRCASLLHGGQEQASLSTRMAAGLAAGLLITLLLERNGVYRENGSLLRIRDTERILRVAAQALLIVLPLGLFVAPGLRWEVILLGASILPLLLMLQKAFCPRMLLTLFPRPPDAHRTVVYGAGDTARRIVSALLQAHRLRLDPVAIVEDDPRPEAARSVEMGYRRLRSVPIQPGPIDPALLEACRCSLLIVAASNLSAHQVAAAEEAARHAGVRTAFLSGPEIANPLHAETTVLDGLWLVANPPGPSPRLYALAKRCFDLLASAVLLVLLAPLLALIALLVRLDSPGPALFVQQRIGRNGQRFSICKFRSMYIDVPRYERSPTTSRDPRMTRFGRLLRRTSLDELPQLLNVLAGSMSLVGPRPEMPFIVHDYSLEQRRRLQVPPGLTGLWQLSADRAFPIHHALEYDLYYIRNRGFFMDLAILLHTFFYAVRGGI
ncbi:MAG TPA: exopolysaccharide biosynthesis polyprenyl glycosylphosphotransferase [Acidobacteriaceae bacterium]|nr:exopolysaccharide biosynthesis polyprenyl glycosylphosphotransferase [Acidobacteriaceae bacterium]